MCSEAGRERERLLRELHHVSSGSCTSEPLFPFGTYECADLGHAVLSGRGGDVDFLHAEAGFQHAQATRDLDRRYEQLLRSEASRASILQLDAEQAERRRRDLLRRRQEEQALLARASPKQREALRQRQEGAWDEWWKHRGRGSSFPDRASMVAAHARLWLLHAALGDGCTHCVDPCDDHACPSCSGSLDPDPVRHATLATRRASVLLGPAHPVAVRVYERRCVTPGCGHAVGYDGASDGVVNWSNERLFCEEIFRDFWNTFFTQQQQTMHSTWLRIRQVYETGGFAKGLFVSRKVFT